MRSLRSKTARRKTLELVAERGPATNAFEALFMALDADAEDSPDAVRDDLARVTTAG